MNIDQILNKINEDDSRSYYSFETFILNLLKVHIEAQGKIFTIPPELRNFGDAIAEKGFDEFNGRTLIEVKFSLDKTFSKEIINIISSDSINFDSKKIENVIIITARPVAEHLRSNFKFEKGTSLYSLNVIIWGTKEINKIINLHKKETNRIANNLFKLRLESAIIRKRLDWNQERQIRIKQVRDFYTNGQFALFLGAGVSSSAGMPSWNTLLNSLFVTYLAKEFDDKQIINDSDIKNLIDRLNEIDEPSALIAGRYLRKGLSKGGGEFSEFTKAIMKNLYKFGQPNLLSTSPLVKAIVDLCIPRRTGAKVRTVINYNFDDLLEKHLEKASIQCHAIYLENDIYDPDELPIYHVHGFLPEEAHKYKFLEQSTLVFSEEGYHQIYTNAYHWSNLIQLNTLKEYHCLMVGLSMTDPNLRRLLDISSSALESTKHFAFMKRLTKEDFCFDKDGKKVINDSKEVDIFLERHHNLNEEVMKELGVLILWYTSYEEIPLLINEIKNY